MSKRKFRILGNSTKISLNISKYSSISVIWAIYSKIKQLFDRLENNKVDDQRFNNQMIILQFKFTDTISQLTYTKTKNDHFFSQRFDSLKSNIVDTKTRNCNFFIQMRIKHNIAYIDNNNNKRTACTLYEIHTPSSIHIYDSFNIHHNLMRALYMYTLESN